MPALVEVECVRRLVVMLNLLVLFVVWCFAMSRGLTVIVLVIVRRALIVRWLSLARTVKLPLPVDRVALGRSVLSSVLPVLRVSTVLALGLVCWGAVMRRALTRRSCRRQVRRLVCRYLRVIAIIRSFVRMVLSVRAVKR